MSKTKSRKAADDTRVEQLAPAGTEGDTQFDTQEQKGESMAEAAVEEARKEGATVHDVEPGAPAVQEIIHGDPTPHDTDVVTDDLSDYKTSEQAAKENEENDDKSQILPADPINEHNATEHAHQFAAQTQQIPAEREDGEEQEYVKAEPQFQNVPLNFQATASGFQQFLSSAVTNAVNKMREEGTESEKILLDPMHVSGIPGPIEITVAKKK